MKPSNELIRIFKDEQGNLRKPELDDFYHSLLKNKKHYDIPEITDFLVNELGVKDIIDRISEIYPLMFLKANYVNDLNLHDKIIRINNDAFRGCTSLQNVDATTESLKSIDSNAFNGCTSLKKILLGNGLKEIDKDCFRDCVALKEIVIPENVEIIRGAAFMGSGLQRIICRAKNITIDKYAINGLTQLESIEFADNTSVTLKTNAIAECPRLKKIRFPKNGFVSLENKAIKDYSKDLKILMNNTSKIEGPFETEGDLYYNKEHIVPDY